MIVQLRRPAGGPALLARAPFTRGLGAAVAAVALVAGLAGCTQTAESGVAADDCSPVATAGDASNLVTTTGAFGSVADPDFPTPLRAAGLEVTHGGAGTGAPITEHGVFSGHIQMLDGATGSVLVPYTALRDGPDLESDGATSGAPVTVASIRAQWPGLADALQCAQAGERITAAMPVATLFGTRAAATPADPNATVVAIVDVARVFPSSAAGVVLPPQDGIPAVVTAPSGHPGVTMPQQAPPAEMRSAVRVQGFGPSVQPGDQLTLQAAFFAWDSGECLASTWDPTHTVLQLPAVEGPSADGLYGAASALVGQPVGSQVVVIVPPEQAARFPGPVPPSITGNDTLVLVIDILAADPTGA